MVQLAMVGSYSSFDFKILLPKILLAENSTELTQPYSYKTLKKYTNPLQPKILADICFETYFIVLSNR